MHPSLQIPSLDEIVASLSTLSADRLRSIRSYLDLLAERKDDEIVVLADVPRGAGHEVALTFRLDAKTDDPTEGPGQRFEAFRHRVLDEGLTTAAVARKLRITNEAVRQRVGRKELFGLKVGRDYRFPPWQFDARTSQGVLPGLFEILAVSILDPIELVAWFEHHNTALDGLTPIEALRRPEMLEDVVAAAEAAGVT